MKPLTRVLSFTLWLGSFYCHAQRTIIISNDGRIVGLTQESSQYVDYYTAAYGPDKQGKVAKLGDAAIDYYTAAYGPNKQGRISQIGTTVIDYYTAAYGPDKQGKVAKIGDTIIDYYTAAYGPDKQGKVSEIRPGKVPVQIAVSL